MFFFSKRLASVAVDNRSDTLNTKTTLLHQKVNNPKDIPANAISLDPLNHQHEGSDCETAKRNRVKIDSIRNQALSRRKQYETQLNTAQTQLLKGQDDYSKLQHQYSTIRSNEPLQHEDLVSSIERQYKHDKDLLKHQQHQLVTDLKHIGIPDLPSDITTRITTSKTKDGTPIHDFTQLKNVVVQKHKNKLQGIEDAITSFQSQYNTSLTDAPARSKNLTQLRYDKDMAKLTTQHNKDLDALQHVYQTTRSRLLNSQRNSDQFNSKCTSFDDALSKKNNLLRELNNQLNLAKSSKLSNSDWDRLNYDAKTEVDNMKTKIDLYENAMKQELSALSSKNGERLNNYDKQLGVERSNIKMVNNHRRDELKHRHDNTSVELSWGTSSIMMPIQTMVQVQRPLIKPVLVQSVDTVNIPTTTHVPITNDFYSKDGHNSGKSYNKQIKLLPLPTLDTTILHSTSVPRINAIEEEKIEVKRTTVPQQRIERGFKTVTETISRPDVVLHTNESFVLPALDIATTTTSTIHTQPNRSTTTTTKSSSR